MHKNLTTNQLLDRFKFFKQIHGHYPTRYELVERNGFPNVKTFERRYGGLTAFRKLLDDETLDHRSKRNVAAFNARGHQTELDMKAFLVSRFSHTMVHREEPYTDDKRNRSDFVVYTSPKIVIDVFYPVDVRSLGGCLRHKIEKYKFFTPLMGTHRLYFVCMNDALPQSDLDAYRAKRKTPIPFEVDLLSFETFKAKMI